MKCLCEGKLLPTPCYNKTFDPNGKIYRCHDCRMCIVYPLPSLETLNRYYRDTWSNDCIVTDSPLIIKLFQSISWGHMRIKNDFRWPFLKTVLPSNHLKILEMGGGEGSFSYYLKRKGFDVSVIEPSKIFQDQLKKKGIKVIGSDLEDLTLKKYFDVCFSFHVLEHLNNPVDFLSKIHTLLKPKGLFLGEVPNVPYALDELSEIEKESIFNNAHLFHYSCEGLEKLFKKSGFYESSCREIGFKDSGIRKVFPKANFHFIHPSFKVPFLLKLQSLLHMSECVFKRKSAVVTKGKGELGFREPNDFIFFKAIA